MKKFTIIFSTLLIISLLTVSTGAQEGIDSEAIIDRILTVEAEQYSQIKDIVYLAEALKYEKDGEVKERFIKKVSIKYEADTAFYHEDYLEYYKKDEKQSDKDCQKQAKELIEKSNKRKAKNISYRFITPFLSDHRPMYEITYEGIASEKIEGFTCHHFKVRSKEELDDNINGDYFFEAESFHLVKLDFTPAKLVSKMMFKMKELNFSLLFAVNDYGFWLPTQIDIAGKGKAGLFFGINFSSTEFYRDPIINGGVDESLFKEGEDE